MATLPQLTLKFNRQIKLSNDGGTLSSDTGTLIFREFDEKLGFSQSLTKHLHLNDKRSYFIHSNEQLLCQKIYRMIAGYAEDDAADQLAEDPIFTQLLGTAKHASQPSLSPVFGNDSMHNPSNSYNWQIKSCLIKYIAIGSPKRLF